MEAGTVKGLERAHVLERLQEGPPAQTTMSETGDATRGRHAGAQWCSIHGATPFENGDLVDGLFTSAPLTGVNTLPLSVELLGDFNVITGSYMPEYRRSMGGIIEATTLSGSRNFHGSVFANWAPGLRIDGMMRRETTHVVVEQPRNFGVDVHKRESRVCILAAEGAVIEKRIRTERMRFAELLGGRPRARILLESSTESGGWRGAWKGWGTRWWPTQLLAHVRHTQPPGEDGQARRPHAG